jgi:ABC-type polar amino acid transport system ATPase subunit
MDSFSFGLNTYRCFFQQSTSHVPLVRGSITALVGANNSGKSAWLRSIHELRNFLSGAFGSGSWQQVGANRTWISQAQGATQFIGIQDPTDLVPANLLKLEKKISFEIRVADVMHEMSVYDQHLSVQQQTIKSNSERNEVDVNSGAEAARLLANSIYFGPFRNISNQAGNTGGAIHYELPVGESFITQWRQLKTGSSRDSKLAVIETQRELASLLGYQSLEINASEDNKTLNLVFDGHLILSLADVGSGIAQMIFAVVTAANRKPEFILIDEPELHLHPTMQAKFVEALARHAKYGVVFATHSIGLARQVATQIFSVTRDRVSGKSTIAPFESTKHAGQLLGELSYSQFAAIGGTHLLLVEGTSEVKVMRVLLRKLGIDADVMIVPLGGSSLITSDKDAELSEFQRIGADVFVLVDSERVSADAAIDRDRAAFIETCKRLFNPSQIHATERRATENYWSDSAIKQIKSDKFRALEAYQLLRDAENGWSKNENWRIAEATDWQELQETDLGQFLLRIKTSVAESKAKG